MEQINIPGIPRILVVDDSEIHLSIMQGMIESLGYVALLAIDVKQAIELIQQEIPQIILLDLNMPEMNGYDFIEILKSNAITKGIPVIVVSGAESSEERIKSFQAGAVDFIEKPFNLEEVRIRLNTHLSLYQMQKETEQYNQKLNQLVNQQAKRLEEDQRNILYALAKMTESIGVEAGYHHLDNVSYNARILAQSLALTTKYENIITEEFIDNIEVAALLHDIGKIVIPEAILNKPKKLTEKEYEVAKQHALQGSLILQKIKATCGENKFLDMAEEIAHHHHEKWNGTGYPDRLKGNDISLASRIVSLVEFYDVMINAQVYKEKIEEEVALMIIRGEAGRSFDPEIVEIFTRVIHQFH